MKTNKGFTLIELLVVVLIIGILAAIAVPKYTLAVEKSRVAQILSAVKSITQAQETYYLANGRYTDNINDLDINIAVPEGWTMSFWKEDGGYNKVEFVHYSDKTNYIAIISYYQNSVEGVHQGQIYCWANANDPFGKKLCKSVGSKEGYTDSNGNIRIII